MAKISVIINTINEEENLKGCLKSIGWVQEIVVVDMYSEDKTVALAKKAGAKVFFRKFSPYVEPARNFAISKATGDWILILDPDEEVSPSLAKTLQELSQNSQDLTYFRLPRKNIIFNKWIKHSRWWPDYNIRFFKKGHIRWSEKIHSVPLTRGEGKDLEAKEANAIVHYHYQGIAQYLERMNRYTQVQAQELVESGYKFKWSDIIRKPMGEFLSRFFAGEGYKDGLHGLTLALLQTFSELIKYLKVWEKESFVDQDITAYRQYFEENINDYLHWEEKSSSLIKKIRLKIKKKI
ncbi:glycosyltransferase family 2 protein [Candidatus Shapirobacteria bacterium]|nr:glycosyltransferase family 2 protein [Candidatus Shapirobacteria bacterium]